MDDEAKNSEQGPRRTFEELIAKARVAKAIAEPHIRSLAQQAKQAADTAQRKAAEYQPEVEKQIRVGAGRARDALEAVKPRLEHLVEEARPRVEKTARHAADYVVEHQDELREAARGAAQLMTPTVLRPIVRKVTESNAKEEPEKTTPPDLTETKDL